MTSDELPGDRRWHHHPHRHTAKTSHHHTRKTSHHAKPRKPARSGGGALKPARPKAHTHPKHVPTKANPLTSRK